MIWVLVIVMVSTIGFPDELQFSGKPFFIFSECEQEGLRIANWLTQDFQTVKWDCVPISTNTEENNDFKDVGVDVMPFDMYRNPDPDPEQWDD